MSAINVVNRQDAESRKVALVTSMVTEAGGVGSGSACRARGIAGLRLSITTFGVMHTIGTLNTGTEMKALYVRNFARPQCESKADIIGKALETPRTRSFESF